MQKYIDKQMAKMTERYMGYGDVMSRLPDLIKIFKMGKVELNVD